MPAAAKFGPGRSSGATAAARALGGGHWGFHGVMCCDYRVLRNAAKGSALKGKPGATSSHYQT
jgi:hypothetical protein